MFKRIGEEREDELEGFVYANKCGEDEHVVLGYDTVYIQVDEKQVCIFNEDILTLIKALTAAYEHQTGKKV